MTEKTSSEDPRFSILTPWVAGTIGIVEIILGIIALSIPFALGAASMWVIGILFVAAALLRLFRVFKTNTSASRWWNLVSAIIYAIVGVLAILNPILAMASFTLGIGWFLVFGGIFRLFASMRVGKVPGKGWLIFNSIITLGLGIIIVATFPQSAAWFLGTVIACELIFSGWAMFFVAFASGKNKD